MAQPISYQAAHRDPRVELRTRLEAAPLEHSEALLSAYEILQGLHDKGVLEVLRGGLGSGEKVVEIAVEAARSPETIRGLRNLLLVANMLGAIDPDALSAFTRSVPPALDATRREAKPPGLWKLAMSFLRDGDVRRGLSALTFLLKGLGESLARDDRHG